LLVAIKRALGESRQMPGFNHNPWCLCGWCTKYASGIDWPPLPPPKLQPNVAEVAPQMFARKEPATLLPLPAGTGDSWQVIDVAVVMGSPQSGSLRVQCEVREIFPCFGSFASMI